MQAQTHSPTTPKAPPPRSEHTATLVKDAESARAHNRVTIGCNLPHGLVIRLYAPELGEDGKNTVMKPASEEVKLNGANSSKIIGGCGLTEVDADFWEEWKKQVRDFAPLKRGNLWEQPDMAHAASAALEFGAIPTGAERLDPDKPKIKGVKTAEKD